MFKGAYMTERAKRIRALMARENELEWYSDEWVLLNWYKLGLEIRECRKDPNYRKDTIKLVWTSVQTSTSGSCPHV